MGSITRRVVWPSIGGLALLGLIGVAGATWLKRDLEPEIQAGEESP